MTAAYQRPALDPRRARLELLTVPHCPCVPTGTQAKFLLDMSREDLYGGAAGGGKSIALLMAALQFIEVPGYSAIIFRTSITDLNLPSGLLSVAHEWLHGRARWSAEDHTWYFSNGARLVFGYLDRANDIYRYQGSEFQFIGFDELTQFSEIQYRYLFSRLRGPSDPANPLSGVQLRMRSTTNPGGTGHDWVRARFIEPWIARDYKNGRGKGTRFFPARIDDNPHLNIEEYKESLRMLPPVERKRLLDGDWDIRPEGGMFRREWFKIVEPRDVPANLEAVRSWDLAASAPEPGQNPDYTVGVRVERDYATGISYITDLARMRGTAGEVERLVSSTAERDGIAVKIIMELEGGAAGLSMMHDYRTRALDRFSLHAERSTGKKPVRASPVASKAEAGYIAIVQGPWVPDLLDELEIFPLGRHDDQVDALAQGVNWLAAHGEEPMGKMIDFTEGLTRKNPFDDGTGHGRITYGFDSF